MSAYTRKLQELSRPEDQYEHMGWTSDRSAFILGRKKYGRDGTVKPVQFSGPCDHYTAKFEIGTEGDMQAQIDALKFFDGPQFKAHQCVILASLASILTDMTQYNGVMINCGGPSGGGKSHLAYVAMGMWGHPDHMHLVGLKGRGATAIATANTQWYLHSLPTYVDEISDMTPDELRSMAYGSTQGGKRTTASNATNAHRDAGSRDKRASTLITTLNGNLHSLLAQDSRVGDAASMRVIDIPFPTLPGDTWIEFDRMYLELKGNFGHIGEAFLQYVLEHYDWVSNALRKLNETLITTYNPMPRERFQVVQAAQILLTAKICNQMGWFTTNVNDLREFFFRVIIPRAREQVAEEYVSAEKAIVEFATNLVNKCVIAHPVDNGISPPAWTPINHDIRGRIEKGSMLMFVPQHEWKMFCTKNNYPRREFTDKLLQLRVITSTATRRTLTSGTPLEGPRAHCIVIDLANEIMCDIDGQATKVVVDNPTPQATPRKTGHLNVVPDLASLDKPQTLQ